MLPFFAPFQEFARSVSVTRTADVPGFAFYMYMVAKTGEMRPFVIYVIEEGGAQVVANVLVDRLVEGRHCLKVAAGWKCPDFADERAPPALRSPRQHAAAVGRQRQPHLAARREIDLRRAP